MIKRRIFLAWLQLTHQKTRLIVALLGIGFAGMLMFIQLGFQAALFDSNTRVHRLLDTDLVLISPQARNLPNMQTFPRRRLYQAMNFEDVESAQALYINFADWKNPTTRASSSILVIGFDPTTSPFKLEEVKNNLEAIKLPDTLMFDRAARGEYDTTVKKLEQGKEVGAEIAGREVTLNGLFTIGASFAADCSLITSDSNFLRIFPRRTDSEVSVALIKVKPNTDIPRLQNTLQTQLPEDVKVLTAVEFANFEKTYWQKNTSIGFIFSLGTAIGFIVGVVIVYQILYSDVSDHLAEYATLKAMGFTNFYLLGIVFQEALVLGILGFVPGFAIAIGLYNLTRNATRLPIAMTGDRALLVLTLTIIMCVISGVISMRKLQAADPADIF
ncbi:DevC protein [Synechococcus sp. PCC 7502]|uniref:ABC transporter permease DevC n=1 Tax=Synechococcus sp. PCC 7502 TaxID=1173263 RepID=UPI00029FB765|nr:ABC transporter permease DevC [Synechococcus sp. PCC 7502]AFY72981.1 DevC protein [Synechococcus sp. PCC 7502]